MMIQTTLMTPHPLIIFKIVDLQRVLNEVVVVRVEVEVDENTMPMPTHERSLPPEPGPPRHKTRASTHSGLPILLPNPMALKVRFPGAQGPLVGRLRPQALKGY